jgi:hypothetical protein
MADVYRMLGDSVRGVEILRLSEEVILHRINNPRNSRDLEQAARFLDIVRSFYVDAGDFDAASDFTNKIADVIGDSTYRQTPEEIEAVFNSQSGIPTIPGDNQ